MIMSSNPERLRPANQNIPYPREGFGNYVAELHQLVEHAHMFLAAREGWKENISNSEEYRSIAKVENARLDEMLRRLVNTLTEADEARLSLEADRLNSKRASRVVSLSTELKAILAELDARYGDYLPAGNADS